MPIHTAQIVAFKTNSRARNMVFSAAGLLRHVADNSAMVRAAPSDQPPGCNIYRLRMQLGISMRTLAERCEPEVDHTTIRRLERNEGYTQDTLERVAKVLGTTVEALFLPAELADWPTLNAQARGRIAETLRDAATAQRFKASS